jgi:hypothetical protein
MPLTTRWRRWIIQQRVGIADPDVWKVVGSVTGPQTADDAVVAFLAPRAGMNQSASFQAIPWEAASEWQRDEAAAEDERGGRPYGGMLGDNPFREGNEAFEKDLRDGKLPVWVNSPTKGCIYALGVFLVRWISFLALIALIVMGVRSLFT